jgi:hypothetical protein
MRRIILFVLASLLTATAQVNFSSTTPPAPSGNQNVTWQKDASSPPNISASVPVPTTAQVQAAINGQAITPSSVAAGMTVSANQPVVNVRHPSYGAKGDGVTDDRAAIQAAINAASAQGGGVLFFPVGYTFSICSATTPGYLLSWPDKVSIDGFGTIKICSGIGNYRALFNNTTQLTNVTVQNITIDGNATGNPVNSNPIGTNEHIAFEANAGGGASSNVTIQNVKFINGNDVQSISLNSCNGCTITGNHWSNMGIGGTFDHDSSEIYLTGTGGTVTGNIFAAAGLGVRTAIEVHQDSKLVTGNVVNGYRNCIITSANQTVAHDFNISNNTCTNVYQGIQLWAVDGSWQGVTVAGNQISINRSAATWSVLGYESGIDIYPASSYGFTDLSITGNNIRFAADTLATNNQSGGIALYNSTAIPLTNVAIKGNTIDSPFCAGVVVQAGAVSGLEVSGNLIVNPGTTNNSSANCAGSYRAGIALIGNTSWVQSIVKNNTISDDQATPTMWYGTNWYGVSGDNSVLGMTFDGDTISYVGTPLTSTPYAYFYLTSPLFHVKVPNFTRATPIVIGIVNGQQPPQGSTIYDPLSGRTYTQTISTAQFFSSSEVRQSANAPSAGTGYVQGDLVIQGDGNGYYMGWIYNGSAWIRYGTNAATLGGLGLAGAGAGVVTGPTSTTPGDLVTYSDTSGTTRDVGNVLANGADSPNTMVLRAGKTTQQYATYYLQDYSGAVLGALQCSGAGLANRCSLLGPGSNVGLQVDASGNAYANSLTVAGYVTNTANGLLGTTTAPAIVTAAMTAANCLAGTIPAPCMAGKLANTTLSSTSSSSTTTLATISSAGIYRVCGQVTVTVAATGNGSNTLVFGWTANAHAFGTGPSVAPATQWSQANACYEFYADATTAITVYFYQTGTTGSPTYQYWATLERLQ